MSVPSSNVPGAGAEVPATANAEDTPSLLADEDEQYNSEEDLDFDINAPDEGDEEDASGSEEDENDDATFEERPTKRRKVSPTGDGDDYVDAELDSGDEVTIRRAKEKKKKRSEKGKGKAGGDEDEEEEDFEIDEDEEGGEGGFVRTRGMKMKMQEEKRPLAQTTGATIDVDALWAQMNAPDSEPTAPQPDDETQNDTSAKDTADTLMTDGDRPATQKPTPIIPGEETITIKRTYKFAGEVITEEKTVPRDSAEAKLYLSSSSSAINPPEEDRQLDQPATPHFRRPLRRFSRFDPNPPEMYPRAWVNGIQTSPAEGTTVTTAAAASAPVTGPKLNTVMKSKLDWAAYVDKEGIRDELHVHSKAKEGYMGRMDFLNRVEANREEERRNARLRTAR